jgi:hypothetical protein
VYDNEVVDPNGVVAAYLPASRRFATLQAAVIAASDNDVISMYANTTENVIIGSSTGSGGKDLWIIGCGHKITALDKTKPVITVEVTAGANDGDTGRGERDIEISDLSVLSGTYGFLIQTDNPGPNNTSTLLKSIRSDGNSKFGIQILGDGNEVRGANSVGTNTLGGIQVGITGTPASGNLLRSDRVASNKGPGIDITGNNNTVDGSSIGDKGAGNTGDGIKVAGTGNIVHDNNIFANNGAGIRFTGDANQAYKNSVGDDTKGNLGGGIIVNGNNNALGKALNENDIFENTGNGMTITGNGNVITSNSIGDTGKGNTGDGINVRGFGNTLDSNDIFANNGDGIDLAGGTAAAPNVISNNNVGDRGKGNLGNGIIVGNAADAGNGISSPVEIDSNTVRANKLAGIRVATAGHQLRNNVSGGTGAYPSGQDNGNCEYLVVTGNFNTGGNYANGTLIPGAVNSAFPTTCQGTP